MLISFLAFNFQRRKLGSEMNIIRSELQMMATGVATEHLDALSTMDFENLEDLQVGDPQPVTVQVDLGSETFDFDVVTYVEYVDKQGSIFVPSGGSETDLQEVNVTVAALMNINPPIVITSSRIYSRSSN